MVSSPLKMVSSASLNRLFYVCSSLVLLNGAHLVSGQSRLCPDGCACLGELVDCTQRKLTEIPGRIGTHVTKLHFQDNKILTIHDESFNGLVNLKQLMLSNNKLTDDTNGRSFKGLISLRKLGLSRNRLTTVPYLGEYLGNLTRLLLNSNKITEIPPSVFHGLLRLRMLDLSENKIREIPIGTFGRLKKLFRLVLSNNRITQLNPGSLDNLTALNSLNLGRNRIESLPPGIFSKLRELYMLDLSSNNLQKIHGLAFQYLNKLGVLNLNHNQISQLDDGAFYGLNNLYQLELGWNKMDKISTGWLNELPMLRNLKISNNLINHTKPGQWKSCEFLETLDLSFNRIVFLERDTFHGLTRLLELSLSHNRIQDILDGAFKRLSALQALDLSHNALVWASGENGSLFQDLSSLIQLNLSHNQIHSLTNQAFADLPALNYLDLSGNPISSIQNNPFSMTYGLNQLLLNSAALICDCQLEWFPLWIQQFGQRFSIDAQCAWPRHLRGRNMSSVEDVDYKNFTCIPDEGTAPVIVSHPEPTIAVVGEHITLTCTALLDENVPYTFNWLKDGQEATYRDLQTLQVRKPKIEVFKRQGMGNATEFTTILHLTNIQKVSQGRYQCSVSNNFGRQISEEAMVKVYSRGESAQPIIIEHPQMVVTSKGSNATLICVAVFSGDQPYSFNWWKDGVGPLAHAESSVDPQTTKPFVEVIEDEGSVGDMREITTILSLANIQEEDQGRYQCAIANNFGRRLSMEGVVAILESDAAGNTAPVFITHPESTTVALVGYNVTLRCDAAYVGDDRPSVVNWLKDSVEIYTYEDLLALLEMENSAIEVIEHKHRQGDARRIMTTLLHLKNIQEEDRGTYQCTVSNHVGRGISTKAVVTVHGETPQPVIIKHPTESTVAMRGTNVTLTCVAAFSGDQPYSFNWLKDARGLYTYRELQDVLEAPNPRVQVFEDRESYGNMREITVILHLTHIWETDQGTYQCSISNNFGRKISREAAVTIQAFPSFTTMPRYSTVELGDNVKLQCGAEGHPTPIISWMKDEEESFPADREMRFISIPHKHDFFIVNAKVADQGTYSCVASNNVGRVVAKAELTVTDDS